MNLVARILYFAGCFMVGRTMINAYQDSNGLLFAGCILALAIMLAIGTGFLEQNAQRRERMQSGPHPAGKGR
jgi:hypothetical protein